MDTDCRCMCFQSIKLSLKQPFFVSFPVTNFFVSTESFLRVSFHAWRGREKKKDRKKEMIQRCSLVFWICLFITSINFLPFPILYFSSNNQIKQFLDSHLFLTPFLLSFLLRFFLHSSISFHSSHITTSIAVNAHNHHHYDWRSPEREGERHSFYFFLSLPSISILFSFSSSTHRFKRHRYTPGWEPYGSEGELLKLLSRHQIHPSLSFLFSLPAFFSLPFWNDVFSPSFLLFPLFFSFSFSSFLSILSLFKVKKQMVLFLATLCTSTKLDRTGFRTLDGLPSSPQPKSGMILMEWSGRSLKSWSIFPRSFTELAPFIRCAHSRTPGHVVEQGVQSRI